MNRTTLPLAGARVATRDPRRTKERILRAGFKEFAAKGFAGARVDAIARRAAINKRMLYHYFGDKEALFREVLRRKMAQRQAWSNATPDKPDESLPYWFDLASRDIEWIRLLEWEALQFVGKRLIDEKQRSKSAANAVERVRMRQRKGHLNEGLDAGQMLLAMIALTWFPLAFPQLTRLIMGCPAADAKFQTNYRLFLKQMGEAFGVRRRRMSNGLRVNGSN